ncbi:hypothetical protein [Natronoglycomyces albus]|uniref:Uncharacterized protein n=1 Tax=Natronoglycomyces albus TaxID=2811108 RepID=A0A895XKL6_9ACTN|nr:hypothetical protein [Natronoglycomyces albus]QSB04352.1 hypothetical protein JQS30_11155 [Natronoglycomyces albus]
MRTSAVIRSSPALYLLPIALAVCFVYYADPAKDPSTWAHAYSAVLDVLFLPAFLGAAVAAWDVGRLRAAAVDEWAPVRPAFVVTVLAALPAALLAYGTTLVMWSIGLARMSGRPFEFHWQPVVIATLIVLMWIVLGAAAGRHLNRVLAAPAMLLAAFVLQAYPPGNPEPMWRHLTGWSWTECCQVGVVPHPDLTVTGLIVPLAILAAALMWSHS